MTQHFDKDIFLTAIETFDGQKYYKGLINGLIFLGQGYFSSKDVMKSATSLSSPVSKMILLAYGLSNAKDNEPIKEEVAIMSEEYQTHIQSLTDSFNALFDISLKSQSPDVLEEMIKKVEKINEIIPTIKQ